jgi:hypothetical protein
MTALQRLVKKISYLLFFVLAPLSLIALLIWSFLPSISSPSSVTAPRPDPLIVEHVDYIRHGNKIDIYARLRNPNPRAGISAYNIHFVLLGEDGQELERLAAATYLLPGSIRYVTLLGVSVDYAISEIRIETTDEPRFITISNDETIPIFNSFLQTRTVRTRGEEEFEIQTGILTNRGHWGYRRVDLSAIALDANGEVIGVGNTFISDLAVGQQRPFQVEWPQPAVATVRVMIFVSTNIFDPANTLPVVGDATKLR